MKSIREAKIEQARRRQRAFINTLGRVSLVAALTLFTALPSYPWTYYSGASVGGDGTVYAWGVTDVTQSGMYHTAYVNATLTSPKGRVANNGIIQATSSVREDLSLPFVPNDTGTYLVSSWHSGFCHVCNCWLFQGCGSGASANNAYPINFTQSGSTANSDGRLQFQYTWQSSSQNIMDLADCVVYEAVTYPGSPGTYVFPSPPWNWSQPNPSVGPTPKVPGSNGGMYDTHKPGNFATPYGTNQFDATQVYEYTCPGMIGDLATGITIHREVDQNGSYYTYKVTKSGASASCTLGVNCYQGN
jgi:hypothetical protein